MAQGTQRRHPMWHAIWGASAIVGILAIGAAIFFAYQYYHGNEWATAQVAAAQGQIAELREQILKDGDQQKQREFEALKAENERLKKLAQNPAANQGVSPPTTNAAIPAPTPGSAQELAGLKAQLEAKKLQDEISRLKAELNGTAPPSQQVVQNASPQSPPVPVGSAETHGPTPTAPVQVNENSLPPNWHLVQINEREKGEQCKPPRYLKLSSRCKPLPHGGKRCEWDCVQ